MKLRLDVRLFVCDMGCDEGGLIVSRRGHKRTAIRNVNQHFTPAIRQYRCCNKHTGRHVDTRISKLEKVIIFGSAAEASSGCIVRPCSKHIKLWKSITRKLSLFVEKSNQ